MKNSLLNSADKRVDFKARQNEFAAYIRDPQNNPLPADVEKRRMDMYRELFFNNIDGFLSGNFPVLRTLLDDTQWFELVQDFFSHHSSQSPHFSQVSEEFLYFLENERNNANDFPFLLELAHYEWVEMALAIQRTEDRGQRTESRALTGERVQLSPLAWLLAYQYPVHKISPDFLPIDAPEQATFLVAYRNNDGDVHFMEITPITYRLLHIIQENSGLPVDFYLKQIARECKHLESGLVINSGLQILNELAEKTVVRLN